MTFRQLFLAALTGINWSLMCRARGDEAAAVRGRTVKESRCAAHHLRREHHER